MTADLIEATNRITEWAIGLNHPDHKAEFCKTCRGLIRVMVFRGSGYCSAKCENS